MCNAQVQKYSNAIAQLKANEPSSAELLDLYEQSSLLVRRRRPRLRTASSLSGHRSATLPGMNYPHVLCCGNTHLCKFALVLTAMQASPAF